jgi:o-succinylbenzoate---CoA ligase
MNSQYTQSHLWINGRNLWLTDIGDEKIIPLTEFEKSTFTFIREWFSGKHTFDLYTSGSTGTPKAITVTRAQMIASAKLTAHALQLHSSFNALLCLDTRYIAGKMMMVRSFETGMKLFAVDPCANPLHKIPVDRTIQFAALVPYQVQAILESKHPHLLDTLLSCIIGGAPLNNELREKLQSYSVSTYATYGMTETISHIGLQRVNGVHRTETYQTLPGVSVHLDKRNCLVIRAPYLEGDIVTNDLAEVIDDNKFKWLGRWDHVINSGGIKVSPENLEERIGKIFTRLKIKNSFFVFGVPDEKLGEKLVLVLESEMPDHLMRVLRDALVHSISTYELPKEFFVSPSFVYTNTNKINRKDSFKTAQPIYTSMA